MYIFNDNYLPTKQEFSGYRGERGSRLLYKLFLPLQFMPTIHMQHYINQ